MYFTKLQVHFLAAMLSNLGNLILFLSCVMKNSLHIILFCLAFCFMYACVCWSNVARFKICA